MSEGCGSAPYVGGILDTIGGRTAYQRFDGDCVVLDGEYTLDDLQRLCAHIEYYGYKEE